MAAEIDWSDASVQDAVAIVGIGCRFPGDGKEDIKSPSAMWDFLERKGDAFTDFPSDRLNLDAWYHPETGHPGSFYTRGGCFLAENPRLFDPSLFGINPEEARTLDPAQRKLLEATYEAFEASGTPLSKLRGSQTGCFIGNFNYDHQLMQYRDAAFPEPYAMTGGGIALLSNRITYIFDLHGPSLTLDTACSSSMYALHLACQAIQSGECTGAVVGGSNLILSPECQIFSAALGAVSRTSKCHTFDAAADGYARAEGVAVLYVKSLKQAVQDNDPIRAVIRGTAINANGRTAGITHPSPEGQEKAIRRAYQRAGNLDPAETAYFECHGTGTPVGDPLEVEAVGRVFADERSAESPLLIGSIKTNIGHCEASSGLAGIIKSMLSIEHATIPPIRELRKLNPNVNLHDNRLKIVQESTPWPQGKARRVSVNSFGYGGSNAHTIVEDANNLAPGRAATLARLSRADNLNDVLNSLPNGSTRSSEGPAGVEGRYFLLPFSAHNEPTLRSNIAELAHQTSQWSAADLAYTLGCRRTVFGTRSFIVATGEQIGNNSVEAQELSVQRTPVSKVPLIAFAFTGQGAQWPGMGQELLNTFSSYRSTIRGLDAVLDQLQPRPDWTIEDALSAPSESSRVYEASLSQPLVTAVQIGLINLLQSWNISPAACVGHSSGEIAAAYAAGLVSAAEAIVIAYARGRAILRNERDGRMMATGMSAQALKPLLTTYPSITIACYNSPKSTTLSGDKDEILSLRDALEERGAFARVLNTDENAYHSSHMQAIGSGYFKELNEMLSSLSQQQRTVSRPRSLFVSSVTNISDYEPPLNASYWQKNLESPVLFDQALRTLVDKSPVDVVIELGPHSALKGPIREITSGSRGTRQPDYVSTLFRHEDGARCLLNTAGTIWTKGCEVDFEALSSGYLADGSYPISENHRCRTIGDLPKYRWVYNETFYSENRWSREWRMKTQPHHDLLGSRQQGGNQNEPMWRNFLQLKHVPWLKDHQIGSDTVFPAAGYLLMAYEAACQMTEIKQTPRASIKRLDCNDVKITSPLVIPDGGIEILLNLHRPLGRTSDHDATYEFTITSVTPSPDGDTFTEHVAGTVRVFTQPDQQQLLANGEKTVSFPKPVSTARWYNAFSKVGLNYGPVFNCLSELRVSGMELNAQSTLIVDPAKDSMSHESEYIVHPATLDSALQLAIIAVYKGRFTECDTGFTPMALSKFSITMGDSEVGSMQAIAKSSLTQTGNLMSDVVASATATGETIFRIEGLTFGRMESLSAATVKPKAHDFSRLVWRPDIDMLTRRGSQTQDAMSTRQFAFENFSALEELTMYLILEFHANYPSIFARGSAEPDHQRFLDYMTEKIGLLRKNDPSHPALSQSIAQLHDSIERVSFQVPARCSREAELIVHMFASYPRVFAGEISGIEAALMNDRLNNLYEHAVLFNAGSRALCELVKLLSHSNPNLSILEIGGGTGSATREVLNGLRGDTEWRGYDSYNFTDVTPGFLATAATAFQAHNGVKYSLFDMEKPIEQQGFEREYDLLIGSNVVHASSNISQVLTNTRRLLKPGGKLALFELTRTSVAWMGILGTFNGVWKGDNDPVIPRTDGPFLTLPMWQDILVRCGYSGLDIVSNDFADNGNAAVILTTAVDDVSIPAAPTTNKAVTVIYRDMQTHFLADFQKFAQASGYLLDMVALDSITSTSLKNVICLAEIDKPLLTSCTEKEWQGIKNVFLASDSALWVTRGGLLRSGSAEFAMVSGLIAAVHAEDSTSRTICLDLGLSQESDEEQFANILHLHEKAMKYLPGDDFEYRSDAGAIHTSRLVDDEVLNDAAAPEEPLAERQPASSIESVSRTSGKTSLKEKRDSKSPTRLSQYISEAKLNGTIEPRDNSKSVGAPDTNGIAHEDATFGVVHSSVQELQTGFQVRSDASYVLVGCLGGLGRSFTTWLVSRGARNLVFLSRLRTKSEATSAFVASLQAAGVEVKIVQGDVACLSDVEAAVMAAPKPVRGIIQAPLSLRDSFLHSMTLEDFNATMEPRVNGTFNLHQATKGLDLDFFMMWSSWTKILGSASQANYMASCAFMDAFASWRQSLGLPATSLSLGHILDVGIVSENLDYQEHLLRMGLYGNSEGDFLRYCQVGLAPAEPAVNESDMKLGQGHLLAGMDPAKLLENAETNPLERMSWFKDPRFSHLLQAVHRVAGKPDTAVNGADSQEDGADPAQSVLGRIHKFMARSLYMSPDDLNVSAPMINYGMDSLVAANVRSWLFNTFGQKITLLHLLTPLMTIERLAEEIKTNMETQANGVNGNGTTSTKV